MVSRRFKRLFVPVLLLVTLLVLAACAPGTPTQPEPAATEAAPPEAAQPEATEPPAEEPATPEPVEPEPATPEPAEPEPATPEPEATAEPAAGGTLTIAMAADMDNLDPQAGIGIVAYPLFALYDSLLKVSRDGELVPSLATSWEAVDDRTYRYTLREGITFHSGNPFNAEAVKASVDRYLEPGVPARSYTLLNMIESVEVEDEYTVIFNLNEPFPSFPYHTAHVISLVVDAEQANEVGAAEFTLNPSGTGPFMLEEWVPNDHITLVRNPNYWQEGKPQLERITYRVIPDEATRIVALEAGEVDVVIGVPPAEVQRLEQDSNFIVDMQTISRSVYLGFPFHDEIFQDIAVRQAISHAINTGDIVDFVQEGTVERSTTFYPPFIFGSAEGEIETVYEYDPDGARALLEEAGWVDSNGDGIREKDGQPLEVTLTFPSAVLPNMRPTAEVIQENLREVGIGVTLDEREWAAFVGDWIGKNIPQMYIMGVAANTGALEYVFPNQWTTDGSWNASNYSNPEIDALFEEASQTVDDEERRGMAQELQQILASDAVAVPLFHMRLAVVMANHVRGFENHPLEHFWAADATVDE
jgi:peptide/nickel transport system substrate-binding protein